MSQLVNNKEEISKNSTADNGVLADDVVELIALLPTFAMMLLVTIIFLL